MEIKNLKDMKSALKDIPDNILEMFGTGESEDGDIGLMCWDSEGDPIESYTNNTEKYPLILDVSRWIEAILKFSKYCKEHPDNDTIGYEEPVSSEDFKEDKKSSSYLNKKGEEDE